METYKISPLASLVKTEEFEAKILEAKLRSKEKQAEVAIAELEEQLLDSQIRLEQVAKNMVILSGENEWNRSRENNMDDLVSARIDVEYYQKRLNFMRELKDQLFPSNVVSA